MTHPVGRNDPCPCGSGAKYKHCCADKPDTTTTVSYFGLVSILVAAVIGGAVLVYAVAQDDPDGRVWSVSHGHFHEVGEGEPGSAPPGPAPAGKVWSTEHGHWHDIGDSGDAGASAPPGAAPAGKVWSTEHGHWHDADDVGGDSRASAPPGPAPPGKVWSDEHGHWHDAG